MGVKERSARTVDEVNGHVPVYAGPGDNTTGSVTESSRYAEDARADAVSVFTSFFPRLLIEELKTVEG